MNPKELFYDTQAKTIIEHLKRRQMEGYYCATASDAVALANTMIPDHATVSFGGSMTLSECGMLSSLRANPGITLLDRNTAGSTDEVAKIFRQSFDSDCYFMSTNAITMDGQLVNIDGTGNRVAALIYGPKQVIILAGMNKIVPTVDDAIHRVHASATPQNCIRLNRKTPCAVTGVCSDCISPECICNQVVITRRSGTPLRIKVILIGESFGY